MTRLVMPLMMVLVGCTSSAPPPGVHLLAAASTREAVEELAAAFQAESGVTVTVQLAASSRLARIIEQGSPADVFLSADEDWADFLTDRGHVARRKPLLTNRLIVIVPAESDLPFRDVADLAGEGVERLALAAQVVPAGQYARQFLQQAGVWEQLENRVVDGGDVRAVVAYVSRKEAEAGIVYATDIVGASAVKAAFDVPDHLQPKIIYPLVRLAQAPNPTAADRLYDFLTSPAAEATFRRRGFGICPSSVPSVTE